MDVKAPFLKIFWNQMLQLRVWFHRKRKKVQWKGAERMKKGDKTDKSQQAIDENLKKVYQETLEEDIPDRFVSLLNRLREQEKTATEDEPDDEEVR